MINIEKIIAQKVPSLKAKPRLKNKLIKTLSKLFHTQEINHFITENQHLPFSDFLSKTNQHLGLNYSASQQSLDNIPTQGRAVIIANHPLGSLDGLALLSMVLSVRKDVKIVVNELLWTISPLRPYFLTVDNMGGNNPKHKLKQIQDTLSDEQAVIFFPAGEVSRLTSQGIRDSRWRSGFLKMAKQLDRNNLDPTGL